MDIKDILVLAGGLTGQIENPYLESIGAPTQNITTQDYTDFAKANPPRPLTKHHEPGSKVRGREVWQYKDDDGVWKVPIVGSDRRYTNTPKRQAFEIIEEAAGEGKPLASISSKTDLLPFETKVHNAALDEVEGMLNKRITALASDVLMDYRATRIKEVRILLKTINSLRK